MRWSSVSGTDSAGKTCGTTTDFGAVEKESLWISVWREALRLISRKPARSPRLKLPLPCLNSHNGVSGEPVWKTSLTEYGISTCPKERQLGAASLTFVKAVHI